MSLNIPEIIAHRGASRVRHENTLPAFDAAVRLGADAVELDVHRTADGVLVVHHDFSVVTADGAPGLEIASSEYSAVAALRLAGGEAVPTLDAVFDLIGKRAKVYTEVKGMDCERLVAECMNRHPQVAHAVHSFDHRIPMAVRTLRPGTETGFLSTSYPVDLKGFMGAHPPDYFWQHVEMIDEQLVNAATAIGMKTVAWTANDPARARTLTAIGVAALCTDTPDILRSALSR